MTHAVHVGLHSIQTYILLLIIIIISSLATQSDGQQKITAIKYEISRGLRRMCDYTCDISPKYIATGKWLCKHSQKAIFEARLVRTETMSIDRLKEILQKWVSSQPTISIKGVELQIDPNCMGSLISTFGSDECNDPEKKSEQIEEMKDIKSLIKHFSDPDSWSILDIIVLILAFLTFVTTFCQLVACCRQNKKKSGKCFWLKYCRYFTA